MAHTADRVLRSVGTHDWRKGAGGLTGRLVPRPGEAHGILLYVVAAPTRAEASVPDALARGRGVPALGSHRLRGEAPTDDRAPRRPPSRASDRADGYIVRDGRAVAASIKEKFMRSGQSSREGGDQAAARWLEVLAEVERLQLPVLTCPTRTCAPT